GPDLRRDAHGRPGRHRLHRDRLTSHRTTPPSRRRASRHHRRAARLEARYGADTVTITNTDVQTPPNAASTPAKNRAGDRNFSWATRGAGVLILVVLAGVAAFLLLESLPALSADPADIEGGEGFFAYVWPLVFGTLAAALIALIVATPLALGIALFISHYAPRRLSQGLGYVVDLLAAIPSVVYGLWGIQWLAPNVRGAWQWLADHLGFVPLFTGPASATGRTLMTAGLVLAVMILPIITAIAREVFLQTPALHQE